jgi:D-glycero-D-manno-heptose 1,7-bisphosphate phosphatase
MTRQAIFLDRDGTIIVDAGYVGDPADVALLPGAAEALQKLRAAGYLLIVASNQSGLARGYFGEDDLRAVHDRMLKLLAEAGVYLDAAYYCPFLAGEGATVEGYHLESDLRKPAPGMLLAAADDFAVDLSQSWMIGDSERDVQAGQAAGCRTILLRAESTEAQPLHEAVDAQGETNLQKKVEAQRTTDQHVVTDLREAAKIILHASPQPTSAECQSSTPTACKLVLPPAVDLPSATAMAPPTMNASAGGVPWRAILVLLLLFAAAMFGRQTLRAQWWTWRLARTDEPARRALLTQRLATLHPQSLAPTLKLLDHPDEQVRRAAAQIVGTYDDPAALAGLVRACTDSSAAVREAAFAALNQQPHKASVDALMDLATNERQEVAALALFYLAGRQDQRAHAMLINAIAQEEHLALRMEAISAARIYLVDAAVPFLLTALDDERAYDQPTICDSYGVQVLRRAIAAQAAPADWPSDARIEVPIAPSPSVAAERALIQITGLDPQTIAPGTSTPRERKDAWSEAYRTWSAQRESSVP